MTMGSGAGKASSVQSVDGTVIGYRQLGDGPALIVLHGTMESSGSHLQLAQALSRAFTVYLPDRRGRGLSGTFGDAYSIQKEVEDLGALLAQSGAQRVVGVSAGAIVLLEAMLSHPSIRQAVIFEPPLIIRGSTPVAWIPRYEAEIKEGRTVAALVTATKGLRLFGHGMPRWLMGLLTQLMISAEEKQAKNDDVTMRKLAPTLHYDIQIAMEAENTLAKFGDVHANVMLLGGSKSPPHLKAGLSALEKILPGATRVELQGLNHGATGNTNRGGDAERVAKTLRQFFARASVTGRSKRDAYPKNTEKEEIMARSITTFLMFDGTAERAMSFYTSLFENSAITNVERYGLGEQGAEGSIKRAVFNLGGKQFQCSDTPIKHDFTFTPAMSLFIECESEDELDHLVADLSENGEVLMPPNDYGFSKKFAWVNDRFGVSWQINLA